MHPTLKLGICIPTDYMKQIMVWGDPHHDRQVLCPLGTYDVQQQGYFIFIQDLHVGGAIQVVYGPEKTIVQLNNGLVFTNLKNNTDLLASLKEVVVRCAYKLANDVVTLFLEAQIVQSIMYQKQLIMRERERLCYVQKEISRIYDWIINTFSSSLAKWIHQTVGVTIIYAGDTLQVNHRSQLNDYQIIYDRKIGDTSYLDFPVKNFQSSQTHFLSL